MKQNKNIRISAILLVAVLLISGISIVTVAQTSNAKELTPDFTVPEGFTKEQVQAAIDIETKERAKAQANFTNKSDITPLITNQYDNPWYGVIWPVVDTQYNVYNSYQSIPPGLYISLKTEIWSGNTFNSIGGYRPSSGAWVSGYLYNWNYQNNYWVYVQGAYGYTDSNGIFRGALFIPNGRDPNAQYSSLWMFGESVRNTDSWYPYPWRYMETKLFTTNWY